MRYIWILLLTLSCQTPAPTVTKESCSEFIPEPKSCEDQVKEGIKNEKIRVIDLLSECRADLAKCEVGK